MQEIEKRRKKEKGKTSIINRTSVKQESSHQHKQLKKESSILPPDSLVSAYAWFTGIPREIKVSEIFSKKRTGFPMWSWCVSF